MNRNIGIAAVALIALSAVVLATTLSTPNMETTSSSQQSTSSPTSTVTTTTTTTSSVTSTSSSQSSQTLDQGGVAMMATDPPVAASSVTKIYISYSNVAIHSVQADDVHGWVQLNASGTLELTGIVNKSQTFAFAKVKTGTYNMVRLAVTSASVTYNNRNYSASIRTGDLTVHMTNALQVNSSSSAAALIDIRSFVVNAGNSSSPSFQVSASAKATAVPPSALASADLTVGAKVDLGTMAWWKSFEDSNQAQVSISSASLSNNSLSLTVKNSGKISDQLHLVIVTPLSLTGQLSAILPADLSGSAVFEVGSSGSLTSTHGSVVAILQDAGYNLTANSSTTLSYKGSIQLGPNQSTIHLSDILASNKYLVTLVGDDASTSTVVVAS